MTSVSLYFAWFLDFVSFPRKSRQNPANKRALMILRWRPLEGAPICYFCPIGPHSSTPEWQYLRQRSPEGALSAFCTKQHKIKEKETVKSMSKQKKPKSGRLISVEKVQSQPKISLMYYFSSENSKIWVSTENTLCINCHILNFEWLWRSF